MKKFLLMLVAAMALTGCAGVKFQWSASYQTENMEVPVPEPVVKGPAPPSMPSELRKDFRWL